jgi:hypothetical protein
MLYQQAANKLCSWQPIVQLHVHKSHGGCAAPVLLVQGDWGEPGLCGEVEQLLAALGPLQGELAAEMALFQQVRSRTCR